MDTTKNEFHSYFTYLVSREEGKMQVCHELRWIELSNELK